MKRILTLFLGLVAMAGTVSGQIAAWDFFGESSPATSTADLFNSNLDASSNVTRGATAAASTANNSFRTTGFQNNGISTANTDYFQITLSATTGYKLSLSTIDARFAGTASFAVSPGVSNQFAYSLDGTTFTLIGSPQLLIGSPAALTQVDLSGITALQNVEAGTTVTIRYYASGQTTTGGWGFFSSAAGVYGLAIGGTVETAAVAVAPTVTTGTAGSITTSSATISSNNVTDDGGAAITERGVAYGTSAAPTISGSKEIVSGTTGSFNAELSGLTSNTLYYVRAYATNSAGTSYGDQISFTTSAATAIVDVTPSSLTAFTATYGSSSASQSFTVEGLDLTGDLTVTAPTGFHVSLASGSGYGSSVILVQETGNVSATVYVRLDTTNVPGSYSGSVVIEGGSADASSVTIPSSTVSQKALSVSEAAVTSKTYNGTTAAVITGNLVGVVGSDVVTFVGTGTFASADVGEDIEVTSTSTLGGAQAARYTLVQPTGLTGNITIASQTITFAALGVQELSAGSLALTATASSGLTVSYSSSNTAVATVSGNTVTFVSAGTTTITASQAGNGNYSAAPNFDRELTISNLTLIAGWDFQTTTNGGTAAAAAPGAPTVYHSNFGTGTIYLDGTNGSSTWTSLSPNPEVTSFAGTATINTGSGFATATTTGALAIANSSSNDKSLVFAIDMRNREDLVISYAAQRTTTGFNSHVWSYSTDGSSWTTVEAEITIPSSFGAITLPTIIGLDGVQTAYVRLTVTGASAAAGNNRLDNIQFRASENRTITLTGTQGYRLLSLPVSGTYNDLVGPLWTQGFTGADATAGSANVFEQKNGNALSVPSSQSASYTPGYGIAVGVFADDDASTPGTQGGFPKVLTINGTENAAPVAITPAWGGESSWEYVLAGNPFWSAIDWDLVEKGSDVSSTIWVWDQSAGNYVTWNGSIGDQRGGVIAAGQGFFAAYDGPESGITFTQASKTSGGSFRGKEADDIMAVRLALRDGTRENSTWLQFAEDGTFGRDAKDAVKLAPLSNSVFQLFTEERDTRTAMDIHYLPLITERLELPLGFNVTSAGTLTLAATDIRLPAGWKITIRDESTNTSQNVNKDSQIVINSQNVNYTLVIEPSMTTSTKDDVRGTMDEFALAQNYPNPFNPSTVIGFQLSVFGKARLSVYDVLGREVAVLVDGTMSAGSHSVNFDASNLGSGVYMYKLEAGGQVLTRRMTLVK